MHLSRSKKILYWTPGIVAFVVVISIAWTYLLAFVTDIPESCIDSLDSKKTGLTKHSLSIEESNENGVFLDAFEVEEETLHLSTDERLTINNAWIESAWQYKCSDEGVVVVSLNIPSLVISLDESPAFAANGYQIKLGDKIAGYYSGVFALQIPPGSKTDTLSLAVVAKTGEEIGRIHLNKRQ